MKIKRILMDAESEVIDISRRIRKKDFSGNMGAAINNSTWQISTTLISKIGSLFFTIIIARLLMPELFGLYGLSIHTIIFLGSFTQLGILPTLLTFLSKTIDKDKKKARSYFVYLTNIKLLSTLLGVFTIILLSSYLANDYYNKQIYFAILAGVIYFPLSVLYRYLGAVFTAMNNFKIGFIGEIIYQILRLTLVPLLVLFLISRTYSNEMIITGMILGISFCFLLTGFFFLFSFISKNPFKGVKKVKLEKEDKNELWKFTLPLTFMIFSGLFFSYIDTIMLGRYVSGEYIGFYAAALNLISSGAVIVAFSGASLIPIFSRLKGERLKSGFRKARLITFLIPLPFILITVLAAKYIILIVYGSAFLEATIILQIFSILFISLPLTSLYEAYYTSQKKTKEFSIFLFITTILNVILNIIFINIGLNQNGMSGAVIGVCLATVVSRFAYLALLVGYKKKMEITFK